MASEKTQINGMHDKTQRLRWQRRHRRRLPCDQTLDPELEPSLGAHMVTPRRGYTHHGIYVGRGRVVQYGGLSRGLGRGPVEEVSVSQFSQGRPIWLRLEESRWPNRDEVARRARSRLGENRYNLLTNNCEHFREDVRLNSAPPRFTAGMWDSEVQGTQLGSRRRTGGPSRNMRRWSMTA